MDASQGHNADNVKRTKRIRRAVDAVFFRLAQGPADLWGAARDTAFATPAYMLTLKGKTPDRLTPPHARPWFGDDFDSDVLLAGYLTAAGRRVPFQAETWGTLPSNPAIEAVAHGFGWLRALHDRGDDAAHLYAEALSAAWVADHQRWSPTAWQADTLANRLVAWSCWLVPMIENEEIRTTILKSFMVQARHLVRVGNNSAPHDWRAFAICRGLIFAALAVGTTLSGREGFLAVGLQRLATEISAQVLPDGGHIQRCPSVHLSVLAILTDIRAALKTAHAEVPAPLQSAIDRMTPMLRLYRMGDGGLTVFNGGREETRQHVEQVIEATGLKGKSLINAPHGGFQRLSAGPTVIVADTGPPPPAGVQTLAHAGTLSFEMSVGPHRVIVNCGASPSSDTDWRDATRATAAHSTVGIDDVNSAEFLSGDRIGTGPRDVLSQRRESDEAVWLDTEHDGYRATFGRIHKRRLYLNANGDDFRGEDQLIGDGGRTFRIRFHLHPDIQASLIQGGTGVLLRLPGGVGWRFFADGGTVTLEDSIYLGASARPRRTEQIVVSGLLDSEDIRVKWRLSKVGT